jgi:transposase
MRIRKVTRGEAKDKAALRGTYDHYVAIDWAQSVMAVAHARGREMMAAEIFERPANVKALQEYLGTMRGRTIVTFEESGSAQWLYLELMDCAERIVICDPFANRLMQHGAKTDKIDAGKLCHLLRAGLLKEVYHSASALYELRQLVSGYQDVVRAGVRVLNQKDALTRSHAPRGGGSSNGGGGLVGEVLDKNIDLYRQSKAQYEERFRELSRRNKLVRFQRDLPGVGVIGAVKIVATVVDARRFPSTGKYLAYCGLVAHEKISGGRSYGYRQPRYNRMLKSVYKTAALAAIKGKNPVREYYDHLLARGVAEHNARHAVARYIARISYGMLKSGTRFEPYRWRQKETKVA